jgi:hypothetical protein
MSSIICFVSACASVEKVAGTHTTQVDSASVWILFPDMNVQEIKQKMDVSAAGDTCGVCTDHTCVDFGGTCLAYQNAIARGFSRMHDGYAPRICHASFICQRHEPVAHLVSPSVDPFSLLQYMHGHLRKISKSHFPTWNFCGDPASGASTLSGTLVPPNTSLSYAVYAEGWSIVTALEKLVRA